MAIRLEDEPTVGWHYREGTPGPTVYIAHCGEGFNSMTGKLTASLEKRPDGDQGLTGLICKNTRCRFYTGGNLVEVEWVNGKRRIAVCNGRKVKDEKLAEQRRERGDKIPE